MEYHDVISKVHLQLHKRIPEGYSKVHLQGYERIPEGLTILCLVLEPTPNPNSHPPCVLHSGLRADNCSPVGSGPGVSSDITLTLTLTLTITLNLHLTLSVTVTLQQTRIRTCALTSALHVFQDTGVTSALVMSLDEI